MPQNPPDPLYGEIYANVLGNLLRLLPAPFALLGPEERATYLQKVAEAASVAYGSALGGPGPVEGGGGGEPGPSQFRAEVEYETYGPDAHAFVNLGKRTQPDAPFPGPPGVETGVVVKVYEGGVEFVSQASFDLHVLAENLPFSAQRLVSVPDSSFPGRYDLVWEDVGAELVIAQNACTIIRPKP